MRSGGSPVTRAAACCAAVWFCVDAHTSHPSARTCAVQLSGSIGECDRYGAS